MQTGLSKLKRFKVFDITGFALVIVGIVWVVIRGAENQGYFWQWFRVPQYLFSFENGEFTSGPILQGLKITLNITCSKCGQKIEIALIGSEKPSR